MRFTVGQSLWYVPATGHGARFVTVTRVGRKWLEVDRHWVLIDRKTLQAKPRKGFESPGRVWLSREDYDRWQRRHSAWRHFRRQVQDKWGPPESVTLEQIQAASDLLRLAAFV